MHRSRQNLTLTLALALLAAPTLAQTAMFRGTVVDGDKKPLEGVKVTVTSDDLSSFRKNFTTNAKGTFTLRFQASHTQFQFDFLFEKPGYQSFTQPFSPSVTRQMREQFVMEASQSQVVERHGDLSSVVTGSSNAAIDAFNAGLTAQKADDLGGARAKLEEAVSIDESLAPAQLALAQVLLDLGDYESAVSSADSALSLAANRADALQVKHQALRALGRGEEAEDVALELEAAEDAASTALRVYNEAGQLFQADDREGALAKFRRAAELDPSLIDAHHAVATLELARGNHEVSAEAAQTALSLGSEDVRTLRVLYDAYDALGKTDELTEIAPRLAAVDPDFGGGKLLEQAADNWNTGQAERAVRLSRMALAIDPKLAKAYYFIGLDHLGRGENADAKAALGKFLELAPDDAEAGTAKEMLSYIE